MLVHKTNKIPVKKIKGGLKLVRLYNKNMKTKFVSLFIVCILTITLLLSFVSCDNKDLTNGSIKITDSTNYTIGFNDTPKRVVALQASVADVWLLAGGNVVGISEDYKDYGLNIDENNVTVIGETHYTNKEYIVSLNPDLVIYSTKHDKTVIDELKSIGIKTFGVEIEKFSDYLYVLSQFTKLTKRNDLYIEYGTNVQNQIDIIKDNIPKKEDNTYLFLRTRSNSNPTVISSSHFVIDMLSDLGMTNVAYSEGNESNLPFSYEEILNQNPDYIFITFMGINNVVKSKKYLIENVFTETMWQSLDAVKNNKVYYLYDENHLEKAHFYQYKPNEKWAEAYQGLYDILF